MLHAKAGTVEPDLIDREVVAENEVITARPNALRQVLMTGQAVDIIGDFESAHFCFAVPTNSTWKGLDSLNPDIGCNRLGVFILGVMERH